MSVTPVCCGLAWCCFVHGSSEQLNNDSNNYFDSNGSLRIDSSQFDMDSENQKAFSIRWLQCFPSRTNTRCAFQDYLFWLPKVQQSGRIKLKLTEALLTFFVPINLTAKPPHRFLILAIQRVRIADFRLSEVIGGECIAASKSWWIYSRHRRPTSSPLPVEAHPAKSGRLERPRAIIKKKWRVKNPYWNLQDRRCTSYRNRILKTHTSLF